MAESVGSQLSMESLLANDSVSSALAEDRAEALPLRETPTATQPMLQSYLKLKEQYPEHLLLYQVGDFFEIFFRDAEEASQILQIRLTSRSKDETNPVPMCGVPIHAIDNYLPNVGQE